MENLSSKGQAGLMIALVVIAGIIVYFTVFKGWYGQIESLDKQITTVQAKINKGKAIQMKIEDFKRQIREINVTLEKLKAILPTKSEAGNLYSNLNRIANENHVYIGEIKKSKEISNDVYIELPYNLILKSKFHDLGDFLASLANYPKIMNVRDIVIEQNKKERGMGKYSVDIKCIASTFVYNEATDPKGIGGDL